MRFAIWADSDLAAMMRQRVSRNGIYCPMWTYGNARYGDRTGGTMEFFRISYRQPRISRTHWTHGIWRQCIGWDEWPMTGHRKSTERWVFFKLKIFFQLCTYLLSAWWHGFFLGYYLTFVSAALFTMAARRVWNFNCTFRLPWRISIVTFDYRDEFQLYLSITVTLKARRCLRYRVLGNRTAKFGYDVLTFLVTKMILAYAAYPFVTLHLNPGLFVFRYVWFGWW